MGSAENFRFGRKFLVRAKKNFLGENFGFGRKFWVRAKILGSGEKILFGRKNFVWAKRDCSVGVLCANFAVSLSISFSAAPNFVIHHNLPSRNLGLNDFSFLEL